MTAAPSTLRRDVASAWIVAAARVLSWAAVFAIVWRILGREAFATLALLRGTTGLLRIFGLGLLPAVVRISADPTAPDRSQSPRPAGGRSDVGRHRDVVPRRPPARRAGALGAWDDAAFPDIAQIRQSAMQLACLGCLFGGLLLLPYSLLAESIHALPVRSAGYLAFTLGVAVLLRNAADTAGGSIQATGRLWLDNGLVTVTELLWPALALFFVSNGNYVYTVGLAAALAEGVGLILRMGAASWAVPSRRGSSPTTDLQRRLLQLGGFVTIAMLADFLYAPIDYVLLNRFVSPESVATYAPAVQADAVLITLGVALGAVVLPRAAAADAAGDAARLRRQYVLGTLATAGTLLVLAVVGWLVAPVVFGLWLGDPLPATVAILPLVLVNTVLGGSGSVGRSVLLGMGRARAFAVSVLLAAALNAAISVVLVVAFDLGIVGVILGTLAATVGRCVLWMPWYVLRVTRLDAGRATAQGVAGT